MICYSLLVFFSEKWDQVGGVLLIGYEMYRAIVMEMSSCTNKKKKKSKLHKEEGGDVIISKALVISTFAIV